MRYFWHEKREKKAKSEDEIFYEHQEHAGKCLKNRCRFEQFENAKMKQKLLFKKYISQKIRKRQKKVGKKS